jgi:hypothetical protein
MAAKPKRQVGPSPIAGGAPGGGTPTNTKAKKKKQKKTSRGK